MTVAAAYKTVADSGRFIYFYLFIVFFLGILRQVYTLISLHKIDIKLFIPLKFTWKECDTKTGG